jgi:hypothetical protein
MNNLGLMHLDADRWDEAIRILDVVVKGRKATLGPEHQQTLLSGNALARAHLGARHWSEAAATARECLDIYSRTTPDDWLRFFTMSQLGAALVEQKRYAQAEPLLVQGYEGLKAREAKMSVPARRHVSGAAARIVPFYEAWGKPDKAEEWRKRLDAHDARVSKS